MSRLQGRYSEVKDQSLETFEARYEEGFGYHSQYHYAPNPPDFRYNYEDKSTPRSPERQYKPTALRWPFLVTLLLALLTTLGFLSYAVTALPVVGSKDASDHIQARATRAPSDYGDIGTKSVTVSDPITTTLAKESSDFGSIGSRTVTPALSTTQMETITHVTLGVMTITDTKGSPIATSTQTPSLPPISTAQTTTLTNSAGEATATQVVTVLVTPSTSVETDSAGNPTATILSYPIPDPDPDPYPGPGPDPLPPSVHTAVYSIDGAHYFMGTFLPTIIASLLAIAVRILDANAKSFQPWHALTHERGAPGRESLCLETGGWRSLGMGLRSLLGGQAVVFLASLLSLAAALLVPVSAGAITLDLRGDGCKIGGTSASNCAYVLSVSPVVSKATLGILAAMSLATLLLVVMVGRWRLGVYTNPWSMCTLASLSANPEVRRLVLDAAQHKQAGSQLKHQDFKLDYFRGPKGQMEYGIVALDRFSGTGLSSVYEEVPLASNLEDNDVAKRKHGPPFFMLGIIGRLCLLFLLSGVLVLVLYYARTGGDTAFELFIDSDSFGVQFLFTGLGVLICLFWFSFFGAVAVMNSYQVLAEKPQEARQSVLLAPPTNAFSGLWHAIRTRRIFLGLVSLASILSESLGIFLGNVRFQVTQTFFVWQLCTWTAVGVMSFMLLILLASFFVKWPDMPVEPSTIAGAMYYVCDSSVIDRFDGLSTLDKKERDRTVMNMALLYEFNERISAEGTSSIGLKALDTKIFMP
ncbi:hypothetical protein F5Y09DRAFT_330596 [Xylaria sp. FL1042]|nr:hypothetical protein F5Y09DRAFT_330596 [Xylaria sp. FL1042]